MLREKIFKWLNYLFFALYAVICIYPFYYVVIYSLSDPKLAASGIWLLPKGFTLDNFRQVLSKGDVFTGFFISVSRTVVGTLLATVMTSGLAYLMTRTEMWGRKIIYRYFILTMYVSGGLFPWYLTMKTYHLQNTFWAYVIPGAIGVYNMILVKTYMEQLPESLEEAAVIEGAGIWTVFSKIVFPLSKPVVATIAVYNAVGQWNSWTDNFYLVQNQKLQTLQLILNNYLRNASTIANASAMNANHFIANQQEMKNAITPQAVRMTIVVISVIPVMLIYPWAQRYFTKGILMGAVKG